VIANLIDHPLATELAARGEAVISGAALAGFRRAIEAALSGIDNDHLHDYRMLRGVLDALPKDAT